MSVARRFVDRGVVENTHDGLLAWVAVEEFGQDDETVGERIVEDSRAEGIDGIFVDEGNRRIFVAQCKTVEKAGNSGRNLQETTIAKFAEGIRLLLSGEYKGRVTPAIEELADELHALDRAEEYQVVGCIVAMKQAPSDTKFLDAVSQEHNIQWRHYYAGDLEQLLQAALKGGGSERPKVILDSENHFRKGEPARALVFTTTGKSIAQAYATHGNVLLEDNVRKYIRRRKDGVNMAILGSATSEDHGRFFWYYNNGITITCSKAEPNATNSNVTLEHAQVINGGQTVRTLADALAEGTLRDEVRVLVKAIESDDKALVHAITRGSNSQNAISSRDLKSTDPVQQRVFATIDKQFNFFYEKERGGFDAAYQTPQERRRRFGDDFAKRVVNNESAAQAFLALYSQKPGHAKNKKRLLFVDAGGYYLDVFRDTDDLLAEKLLVSWLLHEHRLRQVRQYQADCRKADDKDLVILRKRSHILHDSLVVVALIKDMMQAAGYDIDNRGEDLRQWISDLDEGDTDQLDYWLETIDAGTTEFMVTKSKDPDYYHNAFFKSESALGEIRLFLSQRIKAVKP